MIRLRFSDDEDRPNSRRLAGGRFVVPGWVFYPFTAAAALWVFFYVSGLFPYLGHSSGTHVSTLGGVGGAGMNIGAEKPWRGHVVPMVKGQTVFVDYAVKIESGYAKLSINQGYLASHEIKRLELRGTASGRLAATADTTGFYRIYLTPRADSLGGPSKLMYSVSWGGLWGENPDVQEVAAR